MRIENAKIYQRLRITDRLATVGEMAAGLAHEIRNPLNAISIAAQRLLAEFEPKENIDEFNSFTAAPFFKVFFYFVRHYLPPIHSRAKFTAAMASWP